MEGNLEKLCITIHRQIIYLKHNIVYQLYLSLKKRERERKEPQPAKLLGEDERNM